MGNIDVKQVICVELAGVCQNGALGLMRDIGNLQDLVPKVASRRWGSACYAFPASLASGIMKVELNPQSQIHCQILPSLAETGG